MTTTFSRVRFVIAVFVLITCQYSVSAQTSAVRSDKVYFRSGFGFSFPVGKSNDYLSTKFSTSLGFVYALGKGPLFLYPKLNLHAYGFDQLMPETKYPDLLKNGRATTYLLNMALGYRATVDKFGFYGFLGGGGGMILTPRVMLQDDGSIARLSNKATGMPIVESGIGMDYGSGGTLLFFEASYMRGFTKVQGETFQAVPLNVGVKTNITKLFFK
jgi:hypothetical protein